MGRGFGENGKSENREEAETVRGVGEKEKGKEEESYDLKTTCFWQVGSPPRPGPSVTIGIGCLTSFGKLVTYIPFETY